MKARFPRVTFNPFSIQLLQLRLRSVVAMGVMFLAPAMVPARAQIVVFNDTFAGATPLSTANSATPSPTPSLNGTAYQVMTDKSYSPTPDVSIGHLTYGIVNTSSANVQAQALFTQYPVTLATTGDWIQVTATFTNTSGLTQAANNYMGIGLFNGNQVQPVPGGMSAAANPLASSSATRTSGYAQNWKGYASKLIFNGGTNLIQARPAQVFTNNNNQDLVGISFASVGTLASSTSNMAALTNGQQYTYVLKITLTAANTLETVSTLYQGVGETGAVLQTLTGTASGATYLTSTFDGLALGWRAGGTGATAIDVTSLKVTTTGTTTIVPVFTTQLSPPSRTVTVGNPVSYSVAATGGAAAVSYEWQKSTDGGTNFSPILPSQTGTTYSIASTTVGDSGKYRVKATNVAGQTFSNVVTLNVATGPFAPIIDSQPSPASASVQDGNSASFTVEVSGNPQPAVQWQRSTNGGANWSDVGPSSQTSPNTYTIPSVQLSDTGLYRVVATNSEGTAPPSNSASLTVTKAPTITTQPVGSIVAPGTSYTLSSAFNPGAPAPTYQWQISSDGLNFTNVAGATNATLQQNASVANSGFYRVTATNSVGSATSNIVYFGVPSTQTATFAPGNNATNLSIDQQLRLVFPSAPKLGISGMIRIRDAADDSVVATIDRSQFVTYAPGNASAIIPNAMIRTVQGANYYYMPIAVYGNEVWITLGSRLSYGRTYYVEMDSALLLDSNNAAYPGVSGSNTWRFSTKASGPATPTASTGPATITIGQDGTGDFASFQGAFDWIPQNNTLARKIVVKPGIYRDNGTLAQNRNFVTIAGESSNRTAAQLIYPFAYFAPPLSVFTSGSLRIESSDVTVRDITVDNIIYNEYHPTGSPSSGAPGAFAGAINTVATTGNRLIFDNVLMKGGQDTLYTVSGIAYFYGCEIWGSVDFIYGAALGVFDNCEIVQIRNVGGPIGAPSTAYAQPYGEVFLNCRFPRALVANGYPYDVNVGSTTYMRPWRQDGATAVINSSIGTQMSAKRWLEWNAAEGDKEVTCRAREYGISLIGGGSTTLGTAYWNNTIDPDYSGPPMEPKDPSVAFGTGSGNRVPVIVNPADYTLAAIFGHPYFNLNGWMPVIPPRIGSQPASKVVNPGDNVTFSVTATGVPAATYQWYKNGNPISGATGASYNVPSVSVSEWGSYTVTVTNSAGSVNSPAATLGPSGPIKVTIASDSTASTYGANEARGRRGWGEILPEFLSSNMVVNNLAASGRSSRSFIAEGRWASCLVAHASYYCIQFAHNDAKTSDPNLGTDPQTTYKTNLVKFVTESRAQGGTPVFLTPPTRRNFVSEHALSIDTLQDYATAMREVAVAYDVPLLDVLPTSIDFFQFVGQTKTPPHQSTVTAGSATPNDDTTHFSETGARQHCYLIGEAILRSTHPDLAPLQAELRQQGVAVSVPVGAASTVQFQGSFDMTTWTNYGGAKSITAPGLTRYLFIFGDSKAFFRAVVTPD